jgi:hypothetical protein
MRYIMNQQRKDDPIMDNQLLGSINRLIKIISPKAKKVLARKILNLYIGIE